MSEWIDFALYAASDVVLWILLPLAYCNQTLPALLERNPEWVAAHLDEVQRWSRRRGLTVGCIGWGVLSIVALLAAMLGLLPAPLSASDAQKPLWGVLSNTYNTLFMIGFIAFGTKVYLGYRWVLRNVPRGTQRSASLQPRSAADYMPRAWRIATEVLTVALLAAWIVGGLSGWSRTPQYWDGLGFVFLMSGILAGMAIGSARRPPNYLDRLYGPAYRRTEVRICYGLRLSMLGFCAMALAGLLLGPANPFVPPARLWMLYFQVVIVGFMFAFARLKPVRGGFPPPEAFAAVSS